MCACAPARPAAAEIELAPILTSPPPAGGSGHMRIAFRARLLAASKLPHGSVAFNSSGLHAGDERDARARAAALLLALSPSFAAPPHTPLLSFSSADQPQPGWRQTRCTIDLSVVCTLSSTRSSSDSDRSGPQLLAFSLPAGRYALMMSGHDLCGKCGILISSSSRTKLIKSPRKKKIDELSERINKYSTIY
jgi:hypothetical protein